MSQFFFGLALGLILALDVVRRSGKVPEGHRTRGLLAVAGLVAMSLAIVFYIAETW